MAICCKKTNIFLRKAIDKSHDIWYNYHVIGNSTITVSFCFLLFLLFGGGARRAECVFRPSFLYRKIIKKIYKKGLTNNFYCDII